ncbi:hypothetical protein DRJ25_02505 [Candidatus Woesearchaeota archaeon]|nr:MAG: hypothetical protein DRJ25_02505 [Candidatus Woesearchaeota archaeon]
MKYDKKFFISIFLIFSILLLIRISLAWNIDNGTYFITENITYKFEPGYNLTGLLIINNTSLTIEGLKFNLTSNGNCNVTINSNRWISNWTGNCDDWIEEIYEFPIPYSSIIVVNSNQIYNFTLNISRKFQINFTEQNYDLSNYYNTSIYSNLSTQNFIINITKSLHQLSVNLTGNTVIQKSPNEISCPIDYIKENYSGYGYCKKVTGVEDIRKVYYITWIQVKDNSSRNYDIYFPMSFISEDLSDLIDLNYSINGSNKNLTFLTSSKTLVIGKNHSSSSLSEGEYKIEVNFSYLYTGPHPGGGSGSSTPICGNRICEIGETPENCPIDCKNQSFELNINYLTLTGYPGSEIRCWNLERGCAIRIKNLLDNKTHIHIEVDKSDNESEEWILLSLDEKNWSKYLDFDILGNYEKWIYFKIQVPEEIETEREYQIDLKFTDFNYVLKFPILIRVEKRFPFSFDYLIDVLNSEIYYFQRSSFSLKIWHIIFISALGIYFIFLYKKFFK